jgi:putative endonuclease
MSEWFVYIVRCADDTLYTGIAKDVDRRINEHNNCNKLGARYTRARRPVELVYKEKLASRSEASKKEYMIKSLDRKQKESLLLKQ